jgi:hypothetical protein
MSVNYEEAYGVAAALCEKKARAHVLQLTTNRFSFINCRTRTGVTPKI